MNESCSTEDTSLPIADIVATNKVIHQVGFVGDVPQITGVTNLMCQYQTIARLIHDHIVGSGNMAANIISLDNVADKDDMENSVNELSAYIQGVLAATKQITERTVGIISQVNGFR